MSMNRLAVRIILYCTLGLAGLYLFGYKHSSITKPSRVYAKALNQKIIGHVSFSSNFGVNMVALTHESGVITSSNHGADWVLHEEVKGAPPLFKSETNRFHMFSSNHKSAYVSWDGAHTLERIELPAKVVILAENTLSFHPSNDDYLLFVDVQQDSHSEIRTRERSYVSKDRGKSWTQMFKGNCQFMPGDKDLVYCTVPEPQITSNKGRRISPRKLFWSTDYFASPAQTFDELETIADLTKAGKFIVAISVDKNNKILQVASVDGKHYRPIEYPADCEVGEILSGDESFLWLFDSDSRTVFKADSSFKALKSLGNVASKKSNSGLVTQFAQLEVRGVALANTLSYKQEQTVITHDDGATWSPLFTEDDQRLHLHSLDEKNSFPVDGMYIGHGNVGESLTELEAHTFMTKDGGNTWKEIAPTAVQWAFANSGSTIVLFQAGTPTNTVRYSTDAGSNWSTFMYSKEKVYLERVLSVPGDKSNTVTLCASLARSPESVVYQLHLAK